MINTYAKQNIYSRIFSEHSNLFTQRRNVPYLKDKSEYIWNRINIYFYFICFSSSAEFFHKCEWIALHKTTKQSQKHFFFAYENDVRLINLLSRVVYKQNTKQNKTRNRNAYDVVEEMALSPFERNAKQSVQKFYHPQEFHGEIWKTTLWRDRCREFCRICVPVCMLW